MELREFERLMGQVRAKRLAETAERRRLRRYETACIVGAGLAAMLFVYAFTMQP